MEEETARHRAGLRSAPVALGTVPVAAIPSDGPPSRAQFVKTAVGMGIMSRAMAEKQYDTQLAAEQARNKG